MEEQPTKAVSKSSGRRHSSSKSRSDVRHLWDSATLSQAQVNVSLAEFCENFDDEGREVSKNRRRSISLKEKFSFRAEEPTLLEQDLHTDSRLQEGSAPELEKSASESSISFSKHAPHRAYWEEQQNRLPLPLMELMENEALEILNKALNSYKSEIGRSHFITKELQRYIEGLRKRRNKRLHCID